MTHKVVLVTGGSSGIGKATAEALRDMGCTVYEGSRRESIIDGITHLTLDVTDEVSALQSGSVDAIWIFYGWAGVACDVAGLETDYFEFADIAPVFDYYTPVIIGGNAWLEENPETAKAFLTALSRGYTYAVENPKEAADLLMDAVPELRSSSDLVYASQEYLAEEYIADAARWGEFDGNRWAAFYNWLNENDLMDEKIDPMYGFTNDYLPG